MSNSKTFEINWFAAAGSALGAVSSAVLLSTLGAAGTLIGAALGSLVITVMGAIYTQSLQKTKAHVDTRRDTRRSTPTDPANAGDGAVPPSGATAVLTEAPRKSLSDTLGGLPWKHIVLLAVGLFMAAMAVILVFELTTGRPVSSFTGGTSQTRTGTTISGLRSSGDSSPEAGTSEEPVVEESPTAVPSTQGGPTETQPTEENTTDAELKPPQPFAEPTPTEQPTAQQAPTEPPTEPPAAEEPTVEPSAVVEPLAEPGATEG